MGTKKVIAILGACLALVAGLVSSATSVAAAPTRSPLGVGVAMHAMWDYDNEAQRFAVLDKLAAAGVGWVRIDLSWCSLQQHSADEYSTGYTQKADRVIEAARARGLKVLGVVHCTPGWAIGRPDASWDEATAVPPNDPADFGRTMGWLADRYEGRVAAWEIWNEPNHENFFNQDADDYVSLLKAAYPAVKQADPAATVVMGGTSYSDERWLRKVYDAGARGFFDALAVHPYMAPANLPPETRLNTMWTVTAVEKIRALMVEKGDGHLDMWFTEFGWSAHENLATTGAGSLGVAPEQQGEFFVRTIEHVKANYPWVSNIFWYNATDKDSSNVHEANFGLLRRDLSEKPSYQIVKAHLTSGQPTVDAAPTNLLSNGDFENGLAGWSVRGGALSTAASEFGSTAGAVTRKLSRSAAVNSSRVLATEGSYVTEGMVRSTVPTNVRFVVVELLDGARVGATSRTVRLDQTGWTSLPQVDYAPAVDGSHLVVKLQLGERAARKVYIDDVTLRTETL